MVLSRWSDDRRFLVPEVVQTAATDCGPASLKALLEGYDIPVSYGRLREACQTSLDGASIDALEDVANLLGLHAEQVMAPLDHVLLPEAGMLPALLVMHLPDGATHFIVIWRLHGGWVQIMDPAVGRRWVRKKQLLADTYEHRAAFPAAEWRAWAGSDEFCLPLRSRLTSLLEDPVMAETMIATARANDTWLPLAALDAAIRMVTSLVASGGLRRGRECAALLIHLNKELAESDWHAQPVVPWAYWLVQPLLTSAESDEEAELLFRGAVLLQVEGRRSPDEEADPDRLAEEALLASSPALAAASTGKEGPLGTERELLRLLRSDGLLTPAVVTGAMTLSALAVVIQALFLRGIIEVWRSPGLFEHQGLIITVLLLLTAFILAVEVPAMAEALRMGQRLETRLRLAFLHKLSKLNDRYFRSRLTSDMARRAHSIHRLRTLPLMGFGFLQSFWLFVWTGLGISWLDPASAVLVLVAIGINLTILLVTQPAQTEIDQRIQTHATGLNTFILDTLLGLLPVRSHSAGRTISREHEARLTQWMRSFRTMYRFQISLEMVIGLLNTLFAIAIVLFYIARGRDPAGVLLLLYWSLSLPVLAQRMSALAQRYPRQRNRVLRILEPLDAPEEHGAADALPSRQGYREDGAAGTRPPGQPAFLAENGGVAIQMEKAHVIAGGHTILSDVNLAVPAGEHVAIVGPSGAGKSSLFGLLLGWHQAAAGEVRINGQPLDGLLLHRLRQATVWVDPEVQIWNRSLLSNLRYGLLDSDRVPTGPVLRDANLADVLRKLPEGMETRLGESGGLVSGGEGQRVRFGRGLMQQRPALVLLDEPFRGLDRDQRHLLLSRARQRWADTTLLCITHDIGQTRTFDRVLVIEAGRIMENGTPDTLSAQADSRYGSLLAQEKEIDRSQWGSATWRRLWLDNGKLSERVTDSEQV